MKLSTIKELLNAEVLCGENQLNSEVAHGFATNKVEDVLNIKHEGVLLITGRVGQETIRWAKEANIKHLLMVKNEYNETMKAAAIEQGISMMACQCSMFMAVATLSDAGLLPVNP